MKYYIYVILAAVVAISCFIGAYRSKGANRLVALGIGIVATLAGIFAVAVLNADWG
jgi:hypothetical protein